MNRCKLGMKFGPSSEVSIVRLFQTVQTLQSVSSLKCLRPYIPLMSLVTNRALHDITITPDTKYLYDMLDTANRSLDF